MKSSSQYVIGIGASAGGLEAIQELFNCMPTTDALTFIIVQHLSPDFNSMMSELLSHNTEIPIKIAENKMRLEPGVIYLIPATFEAQIADHCFVLSKIDRKAAHTPINTLFESLAKNYKQLAIGIILSGTGSDGVLGIKNIAKNNGLTITQTPSEAKFMDMPNKALATKEVNYGNHSPQSAPAGRAVVMKPLQHKIVITLYKKIQQAASHQITFLKHPLALLHVFEL